MLAVSDGFSKAKLNPPMVSEPAAVDAVFTVVDEVITGPSYENVRVVLPTKVATSSVT